MAVDVSSRLPASTRPRDLTTLPAVLRWRASNQPNDLAFTFLIDGEEETLSLTYAELDREACSIAAELGRLAPRGSRALLVFDSGLDYITALFGCLYAGIAAVPAYPPDPFRIERTLPRLQAIVADAQASLLLATDATLSWAGSLFSKAPGLKSLVATDKIVAAKSARRREPPPTPDELAILQYTSGSTGVPRGVVISHANLAANLKRIERTIDREGVVAVSWLPAYHDMGLIGGIFQPVYSGRHTILMSPVSFMQRPVRWLRAVSNYRAWTTAGPNFAYEMCVRKIGREERKTLDLSNLSLALNGAERVREETMDRFSEAFGPCGFRRSAFYPCYGLAEATLMVAGGAISVPPVVRSFKAAELERDVAIPATNGERVSRLVGCGQSVSGQRVVIADPATGAQLPERRVGEIWVSGPSIGRGYWNRPEESAAVFGARLAGVGEGPFLRTGDLGFFDGGELFVAGRLKDVIIIRGRNLYPQDIEQTVLRCHDALRSDGGAAFSIEADGEERLVIVQEVLRPKRIDPAELLETIRERVAEEHGVPVYAIALIHAGALPKTSSGKTRRRACRELFLAGGLNAVLQWRDGQVSGQPDKAPPAAPRNATEIALARLWREVLGLETADIHDNFFDHGGQSLLATQLLSRIRAELGVELPLRSLFESPTIASLAERIAAVPGLADCAAAPIKPTPRDGELPLSCAQQRLWFLEQLEPTPRYNIPASAQLSGPLNLAALRGGLDEIVRRHEALRTNFQVIDGRPLQIIRDEKKIELVVVDLEAALPNAAPDARLAEARRSAAGLASEPFDLQHDALVRATLYRVSGEEHLLALAAHHLAVDGWSMGVFLKELAAFYEAFVSGRDCRLGELPLQYADFAAWQRERLAGPALAPQLKYWTDRFADLPPALDLVTDRPRKVDASFLGASESCSLPLELGAGLQRLAREAGATLYMTLLAAFQTLLSRYAGQSDVCVGSPAANRTRVEFEPLIGFFANTLPLRTDLSGNPTFRQLLARVRETTLGALANQELPLDKLVEALRPERGVDQSPLFQAMFVFEDFDWQSTDAAGLKIGEICVEHRALSTFDLSLVIERQASGLSATLVYNARLFESATIERMLTAWRTLLAGAVADPDRPIAKLPLLTPAESEQLFAGLNDAATAFPNDRAIHELFSEQAARSPDAVAVIYGDTQLSYGELERRTNQLARYLRGAGVGPETPVGVCFERSVEMLTAVLGVLKAGGGYVPLDPAEAPQRLALIVDDLQLSVIMTTQTLLSQIPPHEAAEVLLDSEWPEIARESDAPLEPSSGPDQLAYVIYTSGSTGRPKGIEITHGSLVNHATELARRYRLCVGDRVLQVISLGFDAAGEEIFPALVSGATLVLPSASVELSGRQILDDCRRHRISVLHLPTVLWQQCVAELDAGLTTAALNDLKVVLVGGESPAVELVREWQAFCQGRVRFLHAYGLTEATITSTLLELSPDESLDRFAGRLPIGRPIANTEAFVLDPEGQPAPLGAPGELYLGGVGLARGYRHAPEGGGQRFVPHPFAQASGSRLLRTGDRARLRADGNLEFLGRIDRQIKLRGFRIEPGEIERALVQHPAVREAAVLCREDTPGGKRLVAYIVPLGAPSNPFPHPGPLPEGEGGELTAGALRRWLRTKLPEYMLPSAVVTLDSLPLTSHHKLDWQALPAPDQASRQGRRAYAPPATPTEQTLVDIWAKLLNVAQVGIYDNFFELGGDSILSIQVIARAREAGLRFAPKQLFQHQTIAELAAVEGTCQTIDAEQGPVSGEAPLTPIQHWFLDERPIDPEHFNQAVLLKVEPLARVELVEEALNQLCLHHDALRLRFESDAAGWRQRHADRATWRLTRFDLAGVSPDAQATAIRKAADGLQASLDLAEGPLAVAGWFELGADRPKRLLLAVHHLAIDAVSWRIVLEDLAAIYEQLARGQIPALAPKTTSFQAWSRRLDELAQTEPLRQEAPFWLESTRRRIEPLPKDLDGADNRCDAARDISGSLAADETTALVEQVPAAYRTEINDVLLTALAWTLAEWTGDSRSLVDLESHGRLPLFDDVDLSRTVGWCPHYYPLCLSSPPGLTAGELLRRTKNALRRVPQGGIGYGLLRYLDRGEIAAKLRAMPRAEISFNYLGRLGGTLAADGPFALASEPCGALRSPRAERRHLLEINAHISDGRLQVTWTYGEHIHRRETIERLAASFLKNLRGLIAHCCSDEAGGAAPEDFPLADLDRQGMDQVARLLDQFDQGP